jgi:hypothetical protein
MIQFTVENYSKVPSRDLPGIRFVGSKKYIVLNGYSIGGEAPKQAIRLYEYQKGVRSSSHKWPLYLAKGGRKWYPVESVTEHLLTRIGQTVGLEMAQSKLVYIRGQLRFLSRYFLKPSDELIHGAQIYAAYLNDAELLFVEDVEHKNEARNLFTFQFAKDAIYKVFPVYGPQLYHSFIKMLLFDALVGNNDRHFYNWGVIRTISKNNTESFRFSPIYDTARALFWNQSEPELTTKIQNGSCLKYLESYSSNSRPKTGCEGVLNPNHFDLVKGLRKCDYRIEEFIHLNFKLLTQN